MWKIMKDKKTVGFTLFLFALLCLIGYLLLSFLKEKNEEAFALVFFLCIIGLLILFILIIRPLIEMQKDKKITEELNEYVRKYKKNKNPQDFYNKLLNIENKPKTKYGRNIYHFNLSTALLNLKEFEKAKEELEKVDYKNDKRLKKIIEGQKQVIDQKKEKAKKEKNTKKEPR